MGSLVWLLAAGVAVISLALGYRLGEAEREALRKRMAVLEKAELDKELAIGGKEQELAEKVREVEEKAHELTEQLRIVQEREAAPHAKPTPARKKKAKKTAPEERTERDES
jgi:hypothetical protein